MVKHNQTILRQKSTNCLCVFDNFVGLTPNGLTKQLLSIFETQPSHTTYCTIFWRNEWWKLLIRFLIKSIVTYVDTCNRLVPLQGWYNPYNTHKDWNNQALEVRISRLQCLDWKYLISDALWDKSNIKLSNYWKHV